MKIGGQPIAKKLELRAGDCVEIELPPPLETEVKPVDIPVEILFEDDDVVVVNKPAGMTVHPGSGTGNDTLVHAMMFHCRGKLSMAGGAMRPGIVHRLDKETSGVMIMAKNDNAYYRLVEMFSERELDKEYAAIVSGVPNVGSGTIRKPIGRHPVFKTKMCISEAGRDARTDWTLVEKFANKAALLSCKIFTGRTHQIRVHMKSIGHPVCGDPIYGSGKGAKVPRLMLHAYTLSFTHPRTGERMTFTAPLPEEFVQGLRGNGVEWER